MLFHGALGQSTMEKRQPLRKDTVAEVLGRLEKDY